MVKYGFCKILCRICNKGCLISANTKRNGQLELELAKHECDHFKFWIDVYTKEAGDLDHDQIRFKVHTLCKANNEERVETKRYRLGNDANGYSTINCQGCLGYIEYRFSDFDIEDYEINNAIELPNNLKVFKIDK